MAHSTLRTVTTPVQKKTPQTSKAVKGQKQNAAGGYTFVAPKMERIQRFLILGSEKSFYQAGEDLTLERVSDIEKVAKSDAASALIDLIVDVSVNGRAPKQDPAIFALALVIATTEDPAVKSYGYAAVDKVCRTATTLFMFAGFLKQLTGTGFGMGARKAIRRWYESREVDQLAFQVVKYKEREGWNHSILTTLVRPTKSKTDPAFKALMSYTRGKDYDADVLPRIVQGNLEAIRWENTPKAKVKDLLKIVSDYGLSWEMVPSSALNKPEVWEALLASNSVPLGALLRQLPRLTRIGVIKPLGGSTQAIVDRFRDREAIRKARLHPLNILVAQKAYALGRSVQNFRKTEPWTPNDRIIAALDQAFHLAFEFAEPTGLRYLNGVDTSGSMGNPITGNPIMSASEAAAALAVVTANIEEETHSVGFDSNTYPLSIRKGMSLQEATVAARAHTRYGTDTAVPIRYARENKIEVDVFQLMTDNETWAGPAHTHQELERYRQDMGIDAKLVVLATNASRATVADPKDPRQLDVVGFDASVPAVISAFARM